MIEQPLPLFAIIAALIAPTLATTVGFLLASRNARESAKAAARLEKRIDFATTKTDRKLEQIHEITNNRLTQALKKIDMLEQRLFEETGEEPPGRAPSVHQ